MAKIKIKRKVYKSLWGEHHLLHDLEEKDFSDFIYSYMDEKGNIHSSPQGKKFNLMLMQWNRFPTLAAMVSTKGRYNSTLPLALQSLALQTKNPDKIIIYDDNENPEDLRKNPIYENIFKTFEEKRIKWFVLFGQKKGQVANHEHCRTNCKTDIIFRFDDDEILEHDVIEKLYSHFSNKEIGAVGGVIATPDSNLRLSKIFGKNKIEEIFFAPNIQWCVQEDEDPFEVDHLYSSFMYKVSASLPYPELSKVGHSEETQFTYNIKTNGYKIIVDPCVKTWHYHFPNGGIRSEQDFSLWQKDTENFKKYLKNKNIELKEFKFIVCNGGFGDNIILRNLWNDFRKKYPDIKTYIATYYKEAWDNIMDDNLDLISVEEGKIIALSMGTSLENLNIYHWMIKNNWKNHISEAYKKMFDF